jgi:hypothetical protein
MLRATVRVKEEYPGFYIQYRADVLDELRELPVTSQQSEKLQKMKLQAVEELTRDFIRDIKSLDVVVSEIKAYLNL